ncbi:type II glyceraldehyde-3-phosphate dehydrogenase [Haloarcula laminariae]|uniref:type II glyceraldehyde-3-phosphate dehydrogenase n=1 Tax=Haloarcula laminariae TaxID=2961577 RepID=UPI0021C9B53F|nr:type II glyceraldehyde-3-phosphate dehydrogenase [Halomicroarcula laminariae]
MLHVGINGFGTIGKRVADAVRLQPDMTVAGVTKRSPNFEAVVADDRGYDLYAADEDSRTQFEAIDVPTQGVVADLVEESDVVVDATPSGVGATYADLYSEYETPALFQGGEDADVAEVSFNARANYERAVGADSARVVSCNTTGLSRLFAPIREQFGIEKARVTLVRRGGDPGDTGRGPINDTLPDPVEIPSHHGPDVETVFPDIDIDTMGMKVPTTQMHTHSVNVTLDADPTADEVRDVLARESRLFLLPEHLDIDGAGKLKEYTRDTGRARGDIWENCIWAESVTVEDGDLYCFQAIHQEADVVPENVDAIRAVCGRTTSAETSVQRTNQALGIGQDLVEHNTEPRRPGSLADD